MASGVQFCPTCGTKQVEFAESCHHCNTNFVGLAKEVREISEKSFGVAVALCAVFGILGIHHFYLGNFVHGIFDLGLVCLAIVCFAIGAPALATLFLFVDVLHTLYVMYQLFTGGETDGGGKTVAYPGQF